MRKTSTTTPPAARPAGPAGARADGSVLAAGGVILLATWAAYANSFAAPFVFDDLKSITQNPTIRHLWPLTDVLSPPNFVTGAAGRPVVNLSLAVNYALGGFNVTGYHVLNTAIHALAGLVLLGIVRRTLRRPVLRDRFGVAALPLALAVALVWVLHPLQTESVTCVVQRTESLMGLFYLLTLYGFIRSAESPAPRRWEIFTVAFCLVGMATKEVMVSVPVLVLLYDRTFVAGTFRAAWRQRGRFYGALAGTWLLLAWLMMRSSQRGGLVGFGLGISAWDYALTQCRAIILYLHLAFWPSPLVVDYGAAVARGMGEVWPQGLLLLTLVAGTLVALHRRPVLGFLGFWFFAILAPSSSFVPLATQTIAEHRMYLPLAAVVALVVLGAYRWLGNFSLPAWLAVAAGAGWLTGWRNEDYRDPLTLWSDTVAKQPGNSRAQLNLGSALTEAGRLEDARARVAEAIRLFPNYAEAHYSLGNVLLRLDRPAEAVAAGETAVRLRPDFVEAHYQLGTALLRLGRTDEAVAHLETALRLRPGFADGQHTLAGTLAMAGRTAEALAHYEAALRLQPDNPALRVELGNVLGRAGRTEEAIPHFQAAAQLDPDSFAVHYNLGNALFQLRRFPEAAEQYGEVVRLQPEFPEAHNNLGNTLVQLGRLDEAQGHYDEALRLKPDFAPARGNLDRLKALRAAQTPR
jgi:tetratricopeptide (TPR) repeat protein